MDPTTFRKLKGPEHVQSNVKGCTSMPFLDVIRICEKYEKESKEESNKGIK